MRGSGPLVHMVNGSLCSSSFYPEMPTFRSADIRDAARARKAMGEKSFGLRDFNLLLVSLLLLPVGRVRECERDAGLDKTVSFDRSIRNWSAMLSTVRYVGSNLDHEQFNLQFSEGRIPLSSERASTEERRSNFSPHCVRGTSRMRLRLPFLWGSKSESYYLPWKNVFSVFHK